MTLPTINLRQQKPDRLRHPWVYDNEIASLPEKGQFENGDIVQAKDSLGCVQGLGFLNMNSKISFRYLSRNPAVVIDENFWRNRVRAAMDYRKARYAALPNLPAAYRLVHGEADGMPGLTADVYGKFVVVQFLALGLERWRQTILETIAEVTDAEGIYERSDSTVRDLEGLPQTSGRVWGATPPAVIELHDAGAIVLADIVNGAKTGLFLDQLDNQKAAAREAKGREVLNCFSYTGLFGLRCAVQGATKVTDVEISATFNQMNKQQWERNGLETKHEVVTENVFDYLRELNFHNYRTDMIILDPPAFTKKRSSRDGAIRGYNEINRMALRLLNPNGVLVSCSCSHHLSTDEFLDIIYGAAIDARREIKLVEQRFQPPDHPISLDAPESGYLKCMMFAVT